MRAPLMDLIGQTFYFARRHMRHSLWVGLPMLAAMVAQMLAQGAGHKGVAFVLSFVVLLAAGTMWASLYRAALYDTPPRLTLWPDRTALRLVAVNVLTSLLMVLIMAIVIGTAIYMATATLVGAGLSQTMELSTVSAALQMAGPGLSLAILAVCLAGVAAVIWLSVRLCAAQAATVAEGRVMVLSSLPLTKGRFGAIFAAGAVVMLALVLATVLAAAVMVMVLVAMGHDLRILTSGDIAVVQQRLLADPMTAVLWASLSWLINAAVVYPLSVGLGAAVYQFGPSSR